MPIPLPNLDDRRWADLVDEGRSLIPLYSPEWTNFNPSDPGITLMELFAFIAEMDIYQLNRIPDRHKRKFLELIGLKLAPPKAARTVLAFSLASGHAPVHVDQGASYQVGTANLPFRTLAPLVVAPGRLATFAASDALYLGFTDPLPANLRIGLYLELGAGQHMTLDTRWEYFNQQGWWSSLRVQDSSCGFLRDGTVSITGPDKMRKQALAKVSEPLYYVRVRIPDGAAPVVQSVIFNAVAAEQSQLIGPLVIGHGTGAPGQRVALPGAPLLEESLLLETAEDAVRNWEARTSLDASTPADGHFVLDAQAGTILFGDGRRGRALPAGAVLSASYVSSAAKSGGVAAGEIAAHTGDLLVKTALPATGGADAETLNEGIARAVAEREGPLRAVTLADYEALARKTPGVDLARVTALANVHPAFDSVKAFGVVTVLVVPNTPGPAPRPDRGARERIRLNLDRHRMIGTRVEVTGPTYLEVAVRATVQGYPRENQSRVRDAIVAALNRLFDPLTGGPQGTGWPFGRDVYRTEVLQTIDQAPGVDHVISMELLPAGCEPQCGNICLKPTWLLIAGRHQIEVM
jgi:hypothetical protein